ncbi:RNA polymerase factor sigma-70 [compost metagenome]
MSIAVTKDHVNDLVLKVKSGDHEAFAEITKIASPLLNSMAKKFSGYHDRFEFEDFYSISMAALYSACMDFDLNNPSFLSYARVIILNKCNSEIEYWNQKKRNVFMVSEICIDMLIDEPEILENPNWEFRMQLSQIIDSIYDGEKREIVRSHFIDNKRICEIAEDMGCKYKKVYSTIQRANKKIIETYNERYVEKE